MRWRHLNKSESFQFDWEAVFRRDQARVDPYLVWAEVTNFSGLARGGTSSPKYLQIAIEGKEKGLERLKKTLDFSTLQIVDSIHTAYVPLHEQTIQILFSAQTFDSVSRFVMGMPSQTLPNPKYFQPARPSGSSKAVIAVIDDGCAFAHADFRDRVNNKWASRLEGLWDQNPGADPLASGAGVFSRSQLDACLNASSMSNGIDDDACYRALSVGFSPDYSEGYLQQLRRPASHGTHVLDVAAGCPNPLAVLNVGTANDPASKADIFFVQLPRATVRDTSGGSLDVYVMQGLRYLRTHCPKRSLVVNLSYGSYGGPHDGTTLLETAMDAFVADTAYPPSAVVLPAGNAYDARIHASVSLKGGESGSMSVHVQPGSLTDTFVELWYASDVPDSSKKIEFEVVPPDEASGSGPCPLNTGLVWFRPTPSIPAPTEPVAGLFNIEKPAAGSQKSMGILIVAPTGEVTPPRSRAPHGVWTINIANRSAAGAAIDVRAWIERDDASFGSGRSQSQATFLSAGLGASPGEPHAASQPIVRESNLNSIGNGKNSTVVGGFVVKQQRVAKYSASGPSIAPDSRKRPDLVAACEESEVLRGVLAAGNRTGLPFRMNGTSVAAPVVTRAIANQLTLAKGPSPIPIQLPTKQLPLEALPPGHPAVDPSLREGPGRLD